MAIKKSILRKIAKIQAQLQDLSEEMTEECDEMRGKLDDKPVKYIDSEKWEAFQEKIDELNDTALDVGDASIRLFTCPNQRMEYFAIYGNPTMPPIKISEWFGRCWYVITEVERDCSIVRTCPRCNEKKLEDFQ